MFQYYSMYLFLARIKSISILSLAYLASLATPTLALIHRFSLLTKSAAILFLILTLCTIYTPFTLLVSFAVVTLLAQVGQELGLLLGLGADGLPVPTPLCSNFRSEE